MMGSAFKGSNALLATLTALTSSLLYIVLPSKAPTLDRFPHYE